MNSGIVKGEPRKSAHAKLNFYRSLLAAIVQKQGGQIVLSKEEWERVSPMCCLMIDGKSNPKEMRISLYFDRTRGES